MAVTVALAAHAALLALLAWTTPALRMPVADWVADVSVQLTPLHPRMPKPEQNRSAAASATGSPAAKTAAPLRSRTAPRPSPALLPAVPAPAPPAPRPPVPAAPARPAPAATSGPAAAAGSAGDRASGKGDGGSGPWGDARGAVRAAIGCGHEDFLRLSPAERDACERRLGEQRGAGPRLDPIDPLKRAAYDRQAAADARRRNHEGSMPSPVVPCPNGSNFGTGCLPPEAMHSVRGGATPRPPAPDVPQPEPPPP